MDLRVVLGSDDAFQRAKEAFVNLYKNRKDEALHEIEIKEWKKNRSTQQNNYYWGVVNKSLSNHLGYAPGELHTELLGSIFGWKRIIGLDGREREIPNRRTTEPEKMSVEEFNMFIEHCIRIAAEQGVSIDQSGWRE